jgi:hypothetical protein
MSKMNNSCLNCTYAKWLRTPTGRLSPKRIGQCTYEVEIPKAFLDRGHSPLAELLFKDKPLSDCPTFKEGEYPKL